MNAEIKERIEQVRRGEVPEGYRKLQDVTITKDWALQSIGTLMTPITKKAGKQQYDVMSITH